MTAAVFQFPLPRIVTAYVTLETGLVNLVTLRSFLNPNFILNLVSFEYRLRFLLL